MAAPKKAVVLPKPKPSYTASKVTAIPSFTKAPPAKKSGGTATAPKPKYQLKVSPAERASINAEVQRVAALRASGSKGGNTGIGPVSIKQPAGLKGTILYKKPKP